MTPSRRRLLLLMTTAGAATRTPARSSCLTAASGWSGGLNTTAESLEAAGDPAVQTVWVRWFCWRRGSIDSFRIKQAGSQGPQARWVVGVTPRLQNVPTGFHRLGLGGPAAGPRGAGRGLGPDGLLGDELDGDSSPDIRAAQSPRAVASLQVIVCGGDTAASEAGHSLQTHQNQNRRSTFVFHIQGRRHGGARRLRARMRKINMG